MRIETSGSGHAHVALLHGTPSDPRAFSPLVEALASTHRVHVITLPGYLGEPMVRGPDAFVRSNALIEDALLARGVSSCAWVGFSGGGFRAVSLAFSARIRPSAVVSLSGHAGLDDATRTAFRGLAEQVRAGLAVRPILRSLMFSPAFAAANPGLVDEVESWADLVASADFADEYEALADAPDYRDRLAELRCPIVARSGELDAAVPAEWSREMKRRHPATDLQLVPGAGHSLLHEDREATIGAVVEALARAR